MQPSTIDHNVHAAPRSGPLRHAAEQLVSEAFLKTLMRMHRENPLKGEYGHGGRGEEVFGAQLDTVFAEQASAGMHTTLTDAVMRQLARGAATSTPSTSVTGHLEVRA